MIRLARPVATGVAAMSAIALALATPASARPTHSKPSHAKHQKKTHKPKKATRPFVAHGLVVGHTATTVTLLAANLRSGRSVAHNTQVTVALPTRRSASGKVLARRLAALHEGDQMVVNGTYSGGEYHARNFVGQAAPFHVYLGTVAAIDGNLVTVDKGATSSDDQNEGDTGSFTVDVTGAPVTVDGAPGTLAVGQAVAFLGSSIGDVVTATSVFAFSSAPMVVRAEVKSVSGTVAQVDAQDMDNLTAMDLSGTNLIVNGNSGGTPSQLTEGTKIIALGTGDSAAGFAATLAFAFTHGCDSRHHGDGGDGADNGD